jgi:t-SNARE complex subunit (syntaxin)
METKICSECKIEKSLDKFQKDAYRKDGYRYKCKSCTNIHDVEYYQKNKDKIHDRKIKYYQKNKEKMVVWQKDYRQQPGYKEKMIERRRRHYLLNDYGITFEQKQEMIKNQNGRCAICCSLLDNKLKTHVDHDHRSGVVRGILCRNCNIGLGLFYDDPYILEKAKVYIQNNKK